jgi:hypothetical protein
MVCIWSTPLCRVTKVSKDNEPELTPHRKVKAKMGAYLDPVVQAKANGRNAIDHEADEFEKVGKYDRETRRLTWKRKMAYRQGRHLR